MLQSFEGAVPPLFAPHPETTATANAMAAASARTSHSAVAGDKQPDADADDRAGQAAGQRAHEDGAAA